MREERQVGVLLTPRLGKGGPGVEAGHGDTAWPGTVATVRREMMFS